ncbi:MAG: delta-60 repeat domain-containing protein [Verrucomicrobiales bacterium]
MFRVRLLVFLPVLFFCARARGAPGNLDPTFNGSGSTIITFPDSVDFGTATAVQPDGKIVVVGRAQNGHDFDFFVMRYNPDGSLDTTFGDEGKVLTAMRRTDDGATGVKIQPDGKLVVCGYSEIEGLISSFAVVRYHSDGSLDSSFSEDGKLSTSIGPGEDGGESVAI